MVYFAQDAIPRRDMIRDLVSARLRLGKEKYGHGVCTHKDTRTWGTPKDSWMEMAEEEFADALVYIAADYIRKYERPSEPDDNERILQLVLNPHYMLSRDHARIMQTLTGLVKVARNI